MIHVLKVNSGLDGRWPATEQGDLKFLIATVITMCNLYECHKFKFILPTVAEF